MAKRAFLTKKRSEWVANRTTILKGKPLQYPAGISARYATRLEKAVAKMHALVTKEIKALFKTDHATAYFSTDASIASGARKLMNKLTRELDRTFNELAKIEAARMVGEVDKESMRNMNASLKELSGGLTLKTDVINADLKETMKASISNNVDLIKSIQAEYLGRVKTQVFQSIANGNGLADLLPQLEKQYGITKRRANIIAEDQTRKAYSAMNADRMRGAGLTKFRWQHSGGGHKPRELHVRDVSEGGLNGGIFDVNNPPIADEKTGERALPGQLINCRCVQIPVLQFENGEEV